MFCDSSSSSFLISMFDLGFDIVKFIWRFFKWGLAWFFKIQNPSVSVLSHSSGLSQKSSLVKKNYFILFFNTLISLHLRAISKTCSNLQGRQKK